MKPTACSFVIPFRLVIGLALAFAGPLRAETAPASWKLELTGPWEVDGKFAKGKDLSAAAFIDHAHAVVASDETRTLQRVILHPSSRLLLPRQQIPLAPGEGTELDIEGVAYSPTQQAYFATGSHALARKKKVVEDSRSGVFKLPVDAKGEPQPDKVEWASLRGALQADPVLGPYVDKDADHHGVDIEGLAERDGRLFFALRAPSLEGKSFVVETGSQELFGSGPTPKLIRHEMPFGPGLGAREIVALKAGGYLLVAGPAGSEEATEGFSFWLWPGPGATAQKLGDLEGVPGKAEGVLLHTQTADKLEGVLFFDGAKDGGPVGFRLQRAAD